MLVNIWGGLRTSSHKTSFRSGTSSDLGLVNSSQSQNVKQDKVRIDIFGGLDPDDNA